MTYEKAIELLHEMQDRCNMPTATDPKRFAKSDALEMAIECVSEFVRMQTPEKACNIPRGDDGIYQEYVCPKCERFLTYGNPRPYEKPHHCKCGQAIDWS